MQIGEDVRALVRKYAIKNAVDYGKADLGSVLGKVIKAEKGVPIPELRAEVQRAIDVINAMSKAQLAEAYAPFTEEFERKEKEKAEKTAKPNMVIEGAEEGKVITRFPPEPGGYVHIGNIKQCILSDEFARIYKGKIYLYFDDTNPEKCKQEYVDGIKKDTAWLGISFCKEYYASDYVEKIYESGKRLIRQNDAYVCMCDADIVKKNRKEKIECEHRRHTPEQNTGFFDGMLKGKYEEGQAVVRLKGDMHSDNAAFRDPTLFRIKKAKHYRQGEKYIVWPTYHINTPVIDSLNGVTDVIRGKEYEAWDDVNRKMLDALGLKAPRLHYEARLRIEGTTTSKREMRRLIEEGVVSGWDDPRLVTVMALRRRGIMPEAIRNFVLRFGMSKTDGVVKMDMLLAENKKSIDPIAKHLFFVRDPVKVIVKGAGEHSVKLRISPTSDIGFREYETWDEFYIGGEDAAAFGAGDAIRLKDLHSIRVVSESGKEIIAEIKEAAQEGKIVQWVSGRDYAECSVLIPESLMDKNDNIVKDSLKRADGYVEGYAERLDEHEIVQFERFGYCILDDKEKLQFIFISK